MKVKVLVISDSHGNLQRLEEIIKKESPFDYLIHCGDGVGDILHAEIPSDTVIVRVTGNVDLNRGYDIGRIETVVIDNRTFIVSHGDLFYVNRNYDLILNKGIELGADAVIFGHTHKKLYVGGMPSLFNPGPANKGAYGIIGIDSDLHFFNRTL